MRAAACLPQPSTLPCEWLVTWQQSVKSKCVLRPAYLNHPHLPGEWLVTWQQSVKSKCVLRPAYLNHPHLPGDGLSILGEEGPHVGQESRGDQTVARQVAKLLFKILPTKHTPWGVLPFTPLSINFKLITNNSVYSLRLKGANSLKFICHQGRSLVNTFSFWNIWHKSVVLSLIWLHSSVCQIHNKQMSRLVAYSGNICVWVVHVMNVGADS